MSPRAGSSRGLRAALAVITLTVSAAGCGGSDDGTGVDATATTPGSPVVTTAPGSTVAGSGRAVLPGDPAGGPRRGQGADSTAATTSASPHEGSPRTSTTSARSTTTGRPRVQAPSDDAGGLAAELVVVAIEAYAVATWPVSDAWAAAGVPRAAMAGPGVDADGSATVVSGSTPASNAETGGTYLAFAVAARNGSCAYAYVAASGGPPAGETRPATGRCRGSEAAEAFSLG